MRPSGVWIDLESGDHGELVDTDCAESWDYATHDVGTEIEWTVSDDDSLDDDYVSVSRELFNHLLAIRSACTCR